MKKDNRKRRNAAIGAMVAAGMTAGTISACSTNEAKTSQDETSSIELTAADKVVIDGQEVDSTDIVAQDSGRNVVRPMYGVRQRPIRLMYGPRPKPRPEIQFPDNSLTPEVIERRVMEVAASTLNINPKNVQISSRLDEDFKITQEQRAQLKQGLENSFNIKIYDETFNMLRTVGDLVNCVTVMVND